MAPVTYALLVANLAMFGLELAYGDTFVGPLALWPLAHGFAPWQLVTGAFLHANPMHLATNMFGLWMFGRDVERALRSARFVVLYGASLLTASATQLAVTSALGQDVPTLGASGAVFGVLVAFAMLFPTRTVMLIFPPIPMRARTFVTVYALIELYSGVAGTQAGVAHFAHLGGLAGGFACMAYWRAQARRQNAAKWGTDHHW